MTEILSPIDKALDQINSAGRFSHENLESYMTVFKWNAWVWLVHIWQAWRRWICTFNTDFEYGKRIHSTIV